jgi:hypothetical protein
VIAPFDPTEPPLRTPDALVAETVRSDEPVSQVTVLFARPLPNPMK